MVAREVTVDPWTVLLAWGALQGALLAAALRAAGGPRRPAALSWLLLLLSLLLAEHVLLRSGVVFRDARGAVVFLTTPLTYLHGPLFLAYARALDDRRLSRAFLHALPAILCAILYLPPWVDAARAILGGARGGPIDGAWLPLDGYLAWAVQIVQTAVYVAVAVRDLRRFEQGVMHRASRSAMVHAVWPRRFARWTAGVVVVEAIALAAMLTWGHVADLEYVLGLALAGTIHLVGIAMIAEAPVAAPGAAGRPEEVEAADAPRYARSGLTDDRRARLQERLLRVMEADAAWKDPDLTLADLARRIGAPSAHVSQVLNQGLGVRFFDFVNRYRVEAVKQALSEAAAAGDRPNLLELALECGFSGKSSFHRIFRDATGAPPGAFLESMRSRGPGEVPADRPGRRERVPGGG